MRTLIFATLRASSSSLHSVRTPRWYPFGSDSYVARGKPYTSSARCDSIGGGAGERALPGRPTPPGFFRLITFRLAFRRDVARSSALVPSRAASSVPRLYLCPTGALYATLLSDALRLDPSDESESESSERSESRREESESSDFVRVPRVDAFVCCFVGFSAGVPFGGFSWPGVGTYVGL